MRAIPAVSVVIPTFDRATFLPRALGSVSASTLTDWQLVVVDDGSHDDTAAVVVPWLGDGRVEYRRLPVNRGLGAALNVGLDHARAPLIAYLGSDDAYFPDHLETLVQALDADTGAVAATAALHPLGAAEPESALQLVQVVHRRTADRWVEREELVTDDLERMLWQRLRARGRFVSVGRATCEWTQHPDQRSRHIRESCGGGLNRFRARYRPPHPLRFQSSEGELVDEVAHYQPFRGHHRPGRRPDGLRILLVGELAYNPERVLAFEERGHELFGLWTPEPMFFNTVGPLPFGACTDIPARGWREAVAAVRPDVIYALLNWQAVPFAHEVMRAGLGIPFVWHFKEGPWFCLERGTWPQLVELCTEADATIFSTPEQRAWFDLALPGRLDADRGHVLDGDLPHCAWFTDERAPRLSQDDGQPHTVVLGRPMGIDPAFVGDLAAVGVHTHFHGLVRSETMARHWAPWLEEARRRAPHHFHLEPTVNADRWVEVLSRYDAGWLHVFTSGNGGDLRRARWEDLNCPARLATLAAAGVPLLQRNNAGSVVATQTLADQLGIGISYSSPEQLAAALTSEMGTATTRRAMWEARSQFTFHTHVDRLLDAFEGLRGAPSVRTPR